MAHKSKKKHLKHVRQQQLEQDADVAAMHAKPPGTKATSAALGAAQSHKMKLTSKAKAAVSAAEKARAKLADKRKPSATGEAKAKGGIVRRIARAATNKLTARPKRIISKAKARVRSVLGAD